MKLICLNPVYLLGLLLLLPALASPVVADDCPCDELRRRLAEAQAALEQLEQQATEIEADLDNNQERRREAEERLEEVNEALENAKKTYAGSTYPDGTRIEAKYDLATGDRVTYTTEPGGVPEETNRESSDYLNGLKDEKENLPKTLADLAKEAERLEQKKQKNTADQASTQETINDLRKQLQDCLKNCPPEVTLEIDPDSHLAYHAVEDPTDLLSGIDGADSYRLPDAVGNGWLVSVPVGSQDALEDALQDGRLAPIGEDNCRIMLPAASPGSGGGGVAAANDAADGVTVGVETADGAALPADTVATVTPPAPGAADFLANHDPGWDALPPTVVRVGPDGRFQTVVVPPWGAPWAWLPGLPYVIRLGSGWASTQKPVQPDTEEPEDKPLDFGTGLGYKLDLRLGYKYKWGDDFGFGGTYTRSGSGSGWEGGGLSSGTPLPTTYGEEDDGAPVGILLERSSDRWVPKHERTTYMIARIYEKAPGFAWWVPSKKIRVITIEFVERSGEPGTCLNQDLEQDPQDSPDLYFPADRNDYHSNCSDDPSGKGFLFGKCVTKRAVNAQPFTVKSDDYGSYSTLVASCPDCVPLKPAGKVFGAPARAAVEANTLLKEHHVDLPKDDNDNKIADGYTPEKTSPRAADYDSESSPAGNGVDGDGYSAYEEYRGFINRRGRHDRTDWDVKTLLIDNRDSMWVRRFARRSGLDVLEIKEDGHEDRVTNFNHNHAHVHDQHCLILKLGPLEEKYGGMSYGLGPPKNVEKVVVNEMHGVTNNVVEHELGHGVGMRHHGEIPWTEDKFTIYPMTSTWKDLIPWRRIHSGPTLCGKTLPADFSIGEKGDQASGIVDCYMRYNNWRDIYPQAAGDFDCHPKGHARSMFCDGSNGTLFNRMGRTADNSTRGNCKEQLVVNDGN
jgi:hypothetical protein